MNLIIIDLQMCMDELVYICKTMEAITERLKKIMDDNELSSSQLADRIGVQRSAISHILSGRNKPSLDFILKVLDSFSDISSEWLLRGQKAEVSSGQNQPEIGGDFSGQNRGQNTSQKTVEKVLILYTDKTVEEYRNT
jgi:transcriptional regulator with XRE-family HTH domain